MQNSYVIDRRLNGKNKSAVNRRRFMERYKKRIKKAVSDAVDDRSITDMERGQDVSIPAEDIHEPFFHHGSGGNRSYVNPGNKEYSPGDKFKKPPAEQGGGTGSGDASDSGEGMDDFTFHISTQEFLEYLFEDLELPNLIKKEMGKIEEFSYRRAGFTSSGIPAKLNIVRSLKNAHARKIAMTAALRKKLRQLESELSEMNLSPETKSTNLLVLDIQERIKKIKIRIKNTPFIDDLDLRFNRFERIPMPTNSAVMFCLMDVSGSMTQETKDIAKRFYLLLYMFLKRNYEKIEVIFIRHHTSAKEVDEHEFFYSQETGGTIVSSALKLAYKIIQQRFSPNAWNIYMAQASDGDNWTDDSPICVKLLRESIIPVIQHYSYIEITDRDHQALWDYYQKIQEENRQVFSMEHIESAKDIYTVFRHLFKKH